jgi:hypothetical protein
MEIKVIDIKFLGIENGNYIVEVVAMEVPGPTVLDSLN